MGDQIYIGETTRNEKMAIDFARCHMELLDDPLDWNGRVHLRLKDFSNAYLKIETKRLEKLFKFTLKRHISQHLSNKKI